MTIKSGHLDFSELARFNDRFGLGKLGQLLKGLDGMSRSLSALGGRLRIPWAADGAGGLPFGPAAGEPFSSSGKKVVGMGWGVTSLADRMDDELGEIANLVTEACECPEGVSPAPPANSKGLEALVRIRKAQDSIRDFERLFLSGEFDVRRF